MTRTPPAPAVHQRPGHLGAGGTAALGLLGAVLYGSWPVLQPAVGSDLPVLWSYVSEMAAANRPHHTLVSALDLSAGVCIVLFTCRLQRLLPGHGTARRVGIAALGVFGAATALNARWPMTCAPSLQPECAAGGLALHGPAQDLAATALSVLGVLGVLASMFGLGHSLRATPGWERAAQVGSWLLALSVPLTLVVALLGLLESAVGLPQRALILLHAAWIAVLAVTSLRAPCPPARAPDSPDQ